MINFWNLVGAAFIFFNKKKWLLQTIFVLIIIIQFILIIAVLISIRGFRSDFISFRDSAGQRINQIYSQVYILNTNINQLLEKQK
jgi:hypothetical protein